MYQVLGPYFNKNDVNLQFIGIQTLGFCSLVGMRGDGLHNRDVRDVNTVNSVSMKGAFVFSNERNLEVRDNPISTSNEMLHGNKHRVFLDCPASTFQ